MQQKINVGSKKVNIFGNFLLIHSLEITNKCTAQISKHILQLPLPTKLPLVKGCSSQGFNFNVSDSVLTTEVAGSPGPYSDSQGLTGHRVGLDGMAQSGDVIPVATQIIHTAVDKCSGVHHGSAVPKGAVCFVDQPTVVGTKVEGLDGRVTHAAVLSTSVMTPPVCIVCPPATP